MKKLTPIKLVVAALFLFALGFFVRNVISLVGGKYVLHAADIFRIDSFQLQGRARYVNEGKATAGYEFKSTNGFTFSLGKPSLAGIVDKREFEDTLLYHGLSFIAYSDTLALASYEASKTPSHINLLQFQVGEKKYVDIARANRVERDKLFLRIGIGVLVFGLSFILLFKRKK